MVELDVVLLGEPVAAVVLQRAAGAEVGGLGGEEEGHAGEAGGVARVAGPGAGRVALGHHGRGDRTGGHESGEPVHRRTQGDRGDAVAWRPRAR